jgi:radical SAM-linked protein
LDGWGDHFRYDLWEKAFLQCGLDPSFYTLRPRELDEALPWDHLDSRVCKRFLQEERNKAFQALPTSDCRAASCSGCGVCYEANQFCNRIASCPGILSQVSPLTQEINKAAIPLRRFRSRFAKFGPAKFLGHLELARAMIRAFRRAQIPLAYSQGHHPLPKVSFGPALPVGHESWAEFLDYHILGELSTQEVASHLNALLPPGIEILETQEIPLKSPSIFDNISNTLYRIHFPDTQRPAEEMGNRIRKGEKVVVFWPRKNKLLDLKEAVESLSFVDEHTLQIVLPAGKGGILRPEEALDMMFGWGEADRPLIAVQKLRVQFKELDSCPTKS